SATIRLARDRIDNGADQAQRRLGVEDVDPSRGGVGKHEHVGRVDDLPAANTRSIEAESFRKNIGVVFGERRGEVLPRAGQIREFKIHEFYLVVFDHFANVGWSL